jgi:outer membrane protein assembly factor BamB
MPRFPEPVGRCAQALTLAALVASVVVAPASLGARPAGCATTWRGAGGDWPAMGGNDRQTGFQPAEHEISPENVASLKLAWTSDGIHGGGSTPTVSGSCIYFANEGTVYALDTTSGKLVWKSAKPLKALGDPNFPGTPYWPQSVTIRNGRVHVDADNKNKPIAVAYDASTGKLLWQSKPVSFGYPATQLSSPKVARGVHLLFTTGPDYDPHARPGFALIDEQTGRILAKRTVAPKKLLKKGYPSPGVWATAAVDDATGYAYVGTSNAYSKTKESVYDAAIIKIDIDRHRKTFGQVVGVYKGDTDAIRPALEQEPACQVLGPSLPENNYMYLPCGQQDADFGAGPMVIKGPDGRRLVVELRKDGWLYAVDARTMKGVWKTLIGVNNNATFTGGNVNQPAYDGKYIYTISNPGNLSAVDPATGLIVWTQPFKDQLAGNRPTVAANGLIFTAGPGGSGLLATDASTGQTLTTLNPTSGKGETCAMGSTNGFAIAHNMVFLNCGNFVAAYELPGQSD